MNNVAFALLQAPTPPTPNPITQLMPIVLMGVLFYFLLIRPQQKARKEHEARISAVRRGDTVVTSGGLVGKVTKAGDGDEVTVEIAPGVAVSVVKATLADIRSKTKPADTAKSIDKKSKDKKSDDKK